MTRYQVIAKKFRPQKFDEVVGQTHVINTLKNALRLGRVAHAYLFTGCRGTGKTTLVRLFAKAINCHDLSKDFEPCNACPSCLDISSGRSLDIIEIDGASNRGIDDIRQINETVGYASSHGGYKIIIIDEVHMLTKEAFNALLKTLEEPPEKVKFFFATTEPHKVLSTIMSRCQRFDLSRIPMPQMIKKLGQITEELKIDISEDALKLISKISEGSLRDAESLLDQVACYQDGSITHESLQQMLGLVPLDIFRQIDTAYKDNQLSAAFTIASDIFNSGVDLYYFYEMLLEHYRNILLLHYNVKLDMASLTKEALELYRSSKEFYTPTVIQAIINYITQFIASQGRSALRKVDVEMGLLYILKQKNRVTYDQLIDQMQALKAKTGASPIETPVAEAPVEAPQVEPVAPPAAKAPTESPPVEVPRKMKAQDDEAPIVETPPMIETVVHPVKPVAQVETVAPPVKPAATVERVVTPAEPVQPPVKPMEPVEPIQTPVVEQAKPIQGEQQSLLEKPTPIEPSKPAAPTVVDSKPLSEENKEKNRTEVILNFAAVQLKGKLRH